MTAIINYKECWIDKNPGNGVTYTPNFCTGYFKAQKYIYLKIKNKRH